MKQQVLFIQGAGKGAHQEDGELVKSLRGELGDGYSVHYPKIPGDGDTGYDDFKDRIARELDGMDGRVILVAHSVGSSVLLKYLSEEKVKTPVDGIFLIAAPFVGEGGWGLDDGALREGFAAKLPKDVPIFFYHSRDDEVVPFEHLALYAKKLHDATIRKLDGRGHQLGNDLSEVAEDIMSLPESAEGA